MKVNLSWLSDYVEIDRSPEEIAEDLTMAGLEVEGISKFDGDTILELSVTPNRPDLLCHVGVARELTVLYDKELKYPDTDVEESKTHVEAMSSVDIEDPAGCHRYSARVMTGVTIGPAPEEIVKRLESVDVRSINNIVDATNYVMMELGQPLHAFDYNLLGENRIAVRLASAGETLRTLDGQERKLEPEDLLICDGLGPVAMAGIMGGESSEVRDDTADLLLESACFDPVTIRRGAKRLGLSSEASYRFERGTDPTGTVRAVDRLAKLVKEWAGGEIFAGALDTHPRVEEERVVDFRTSRVGEFLGIEISEEDMHSILTKLGLTVRKSKSGNWKVIPPGFRRDISREEDLIEEIARIYGYQEIPVTMPLGRTIPVKPEPEERVILTAKSAMEGMGFSESITYSFISRSELADLGLTGGPEPVALLNPISDEMTVMRTSLLPGLLRAVKLNLSRRIDRVKMYEVGRSFLPRTSCEISEERIRIAAVMTGERSDKSWYRDMEKSDFFDIKGAVQGLLGALGVSEVSFMEEEMPYLHPGQSAWVTIGEKTAGPVGTLHPSLLEKYGMGEWAGCFELDLEIIKEASLEKRPYSPIPRYPGLLRDIALVVPSGVSCNQVEETIQDAAENLRSVRLFDLYEGKGIPDDHRGLAFSLVFQSMERTLNDEEVDTGLKKILKALDNKLGAKLR
ncbi:MAG: phenylalanine--tRNA ligase subunit beta [bacterium]